MKYSTALIAAVAAVLPAVNGHLIMVQPAPADFSGGDGSSGRQGPLAEGGADYPCKFTGGVAAGPLADSGITLTPGGSANLQVKGTAVHGGGSCQVSVTYDNPPTKSSVFKVLKTFHGGCPVTAEGNLDDSLGIENLNPPLAFEVPTGLKSGPAVFAWTWFNRIGNREMYMNCAAVNIAGDAAGLDTFNALPTIFKANSGQANDDGTVCKTTEGGNLQFPNPGTNVAAGGTGGMIPPVCGAGGPAKRHFRHNMKRTTSA